MTTKWNRSKKTPYYGVRSSRYAAKPNDECCSPDFDANSLRRQCTSGWKNNLASNKSHSWLAGRWRQVYRQSLLNVLPNFKHGTQKSNIRRKNKLPTSASNHNSLHKNDRLTRNRERYPWSILLKFRDTQATGTKVVWKTTILKQNEVFRTIIIYSPHVLSHHVSQNDFLGSLQGSTTPFVFERFRAII